MSENAQEGLPVEAQSQALPVASNKRWYVVHAYSGMEKSVRRALLERVERAGMQDKFGEILVPTEEVVEVKGGQKSVTERRFFPGYILVEMMVTDDSWYVVRNTPRVTGFVGSGVYPVPIDKKEVEALFKRMQSDTVKHTIDLAPDDHIIITDGPFKDLDGKVNEVDQDRGKVKVLVSMFGRETPVELDFLQVKKA